MRTQFNCPNCGAPVKAPRCDYCGTTIGRMMEVATDQLDDQIARRLVDKGLLTPNEAREMIGKENEDDDCQR